MFSLLRDGLLPMPWVQRELRSSNSAEKGYEVLVLCATGKTSSGWLKLSGHFTSIRFSFAFFGGF